MERIDFERGAVASLRRRVAEVEEANDDLVAFARGHTGAVSAIHDAVLAALAADSLEMLAGAVALRWPALLRIDAAAFAWVDGDHAVRADRTGLNPVEPRLVRRISASPAPVMFRQVARGHPLFGPDAASIRSEALIRLDTASGGTGLILLGQCAAPPIDGGHGERLLRFLGEAVSHMLERWPTR